MNRKKNLIVFSNLLHLKLNSLLYFTKLWIFIHIICMWEWINESLNFTGFRKTTEEINGRIRFFRVLTTKIPPLSKDPIVPNFWRLEEYCGKVSFNGWHILMLLISYLLLTTVGDRMDGWSDLVELSLCSFCLYDPLMYNDSELKYSHCDYAWLQRSNASRYRPFFMSLAVDSNFRIFWRSALLQKMQKESFPFCEKSPGYSSFLADTEM